MCDSIRVSVERFLTSHLWSKTENCFSRSWSQQLWIGMNSTAALIPRITAYLGDWKRMERWTDEGCKCLCGPRGFIQGLLTPSACMDAHRHTHLPSLRSQIWHESHLACIFMPCGMGHRHTPSYNYCFPAPNNWTCSRVEHEGEVTSNVGIWERRFGQNTRTHHHDSTGVSFVCYLWNSSFPVLNLPSRVTQNFIAELVRLSCET